MMTGEDLLGIILQNVHRFEVIDHSGDKPGRVLVKDNISVEMSIQDDGKTIKIFLTDGKTTDR